MRTAVALLLLVASGAAAESKPRLSRVGHGWQSMVFRSGDRVIKYTKHRITECDVMPQRWDALRAALTEHSQQAYNRLLKSPEFAAWRHVLLPSEQPRRFVSVQQYAQGRPWKALSAEARQRAQLELQALNAAAQRVVPSVPDPFTNGNVLFHSDGRIESWVDLAAVYTFANQWKAQQPGFATARELINQRREQLGFRKKTNLKAFRVGNGWARRFEGGDLQWGDALVVANLEHGQAYVVKYGFRQKYESWAPAALSSRRKQVNELLGVPLEDGHDGVQRFERGRLTYVPGDPEPIRIEITHPLPPSHTEFRYQTRERLGEGANSRVWRVEHNQPQYSHLTVLKEIRDGSGRRWLPLMDEATRALQAERVVSAMNRLRADAAFASRFGAIVPETITPRPGFLLQEELRGVGISELRPELREHAAHEVRAAAHLAQQILPELLISTGACNFRFDPENGNATSWYDILSDTQRQPSLYR
jgi:hypothetical protein